MKLFECSSEELEQAKSILIEISLTKANSLANPRAVLLGGQPAAGKTGLIRHLREQAESWVVINGDEYRQYHPRYQTIQAQYDQQAPQYTQPFSNALVEFMKEECLQRKLSFIIEGTMRTYGVIESTAKQAREYGFRAEAHVLAIHSDDSYLGIFQRYEREMGFYGSGRFSPLTTHDEAYRQIPVNLQQASQQQLFDTICIYCRDKSNLIQQAFLSTIGEEADFEALFDQIRQPLLLPEAYWQKWQTLYGQARQRGESNANYLKQIADFCTQYA